MGFAPFVNGIVSNIQINTFTAMFFLLTFLLAINDISADAIGNSLLSEDEFHHASTPLVIGQSIGFFFGYIVFSYLNDVSFLNAYFFRSSPLENPLVTDQVMLVLMGIYSFLLSLFTLVRVYEPLIHDNRLVEAKQSFKLYLVFFKKRNLLILTIWFFGYNFFYFIGMAPMEFKYIDAGFSRPLIISFSFVTTPGYLIGSAITSILVKKNFLSLSNWMGIVMLPFCLYFMFLLNSYEANQDTKTTAIKYLIVSCVLSTFNQSMLMTTMWISKVTEPQYASTFKTFLYSISNFSVSFPSTVSLKIVDYFNYSRLVWVNLSIQFLVCLASIPILAKLDPMTKEELSIRPDEPEEAVRCFAFQKLVEEEEICKNC